MRKRTSQLAELISTRVTTMSLGKRASPLSHLNRTKIYEETMHEPSQLGKAGQSQVNRADSPHINRPQNPSLYVYPQFISTVIERNSSFIRSSMKTEKLTNQPRSQCSPISLVWEGRERERVETRLLITRRIHLPRLQKARENKTVAANYPFFFFASFWSLAEKLWGNILISFKMQLSLPKCDWILSQLWSFFTFYKSDSAEHSDEVIYFPTDYKISKSF